MTFIYFKDRYVKFTDKNVHHLHPNFEHVSGIGNSAGQSTRERCAERVRGEMFLGAAISAVLCEGLFQRVVRAKLYRAVRRLPQDRRPDTGRIRDIDILKDVE